MLLVNLIGMGVVTSRRNFERSVGTQAGQRFAAIFDADDVVRCPWAGYHFWQVGETVGADLSAVSRGAASKGDLPDAGSATLAARNG